MKRNILSALLILGLIINGCGNSAKETTEEPDTGGSSEVTEPEVTGYTPAASYENERYLFRNFSGEVMLIGYIDYEGNEVIAPAYVAAYDFSEGLAAVAAPVEGFEEPLWGYIDINGEWVIEPQYNLAGIFCEGLAWVKLQSENREDMLCGYIDRSGEFVIEPQWIEAHDFSEGLAFVQHNEYKAFIDRTGTEQFTVEHRFSNFIDGVALTIDTDENWAYYINSSGEEILSGQYRTSHAFTDGRALIRKDQLFGYIDTEGRIAIPMQYSIATDFSEGKAIAYDLSYDGWIIIDTDGNLLSELGYAPTSNFSEGLVPVTPIDGRDIGYADETGTLAIDMTFTMGGPFINGLAHAANADWDGYIDRSGEFVWKQEPHRLYYSEEEGAAQVEPEEE